MKNNFICILETLLEYYDESTTTEWSMFHLATPWVSIPHPPVPRRKVKLTSTKLKSVVGGRRQLRIFDSAVLEADCFITFWKNKKHSFI